MPLPTNILSLIEKNRGKLIAAAIVAAYAALAWLCAPIAPRQVENRAAASLPLLLRSIASSTEALAAPKRSSECRANGPLPDPACSPGAIFAGKPIEEICQSGYTKKVRNVSVSLKKKIYKAYGIAYPPPTGSYEMDHLIPLAIGGSNDVANLFPEAREPVPGFREKDLVEIFLRQEACAGRVDIGEAQKAVASDWVKIYESLTPEQIQSLRSLFTNWSN